MLTLRIHHKSLPATSEKAENNRKKHAFGIRQAWIASFSKSEVSPSLEHEFLSTKERYYLIHWVVIQIKSATRE